jgi:hypothetical protein
MQVDNQLLNIKRLPEHAERYNEIKDPAVIQLADGSLMMYASIGNSFEQHWQVGRFIADKVDGQWQEVAPVTFENIWGPQLCAPAVTYEVVGGQPIWTMYVQTACFEENGVIAVATSTDGQHFVGSDQPVFTKDSVINPPAPVIGVYDVAHSELNHQNQELDCMIFSGYRRIGCGDLYMSFKSDADEKWSEAKCVLSQEDVPFHNHPGLESFEWGLEGAKLVQLAHDCYIIIGVCFLPMPHSFLGSRQRVFMAAATSPEGPFKPLGLLFEPIEQPSRTGENGHPDTFIQDGKLWVIYQERTGNNQPWHLRSAAFEIEALINGVHLGLESSQVEGLQPNSFEAIIHESLNEVESYYFRTSRQSQLADETTFMMVSETN